MRDIQNKNKDIIIHVSPITAHTLPAIITLKKILIFQLIEPTWAMVTYSMIFRSLNNTAIDLDTQDKKMTNSQRQEQEGACIL